MPIIREAVHDTSTTVKVDRLLYIRHLWQGITPREYGQDS